MKRIDLIQKLSFTIFLLGLCSLFIGVIYEIRLVILKELSNIYLSIITMEKVEVIATTIGAITLISFFIFIMSFSVGEDESKETK